MARSRAVKKARVYWPSWRYEPVTGRGEIYQREEDVPEGWVTTPARARAMEEGPPPAPPAPPAETPPAPPALERMRAAQPLDDEDEDDLPPEPARKPRKPRKL